MGWIMVGKRAPGGLRGCALESSERYNVDSRRGRQSGQSQGRGHRRMMNHRLRVPTPKLACSFATLDIDAKNAVRERSSSPAWNGPTWQSRWAQNPICPPANQQPASPPAISPLHCRVFLIGAPCVPLPAKTPVPAAASQKLRPSSERRTTSCPRLAPWLGPGSGPRATPSVDDAVLDSSPCRRLLSCDSCVRWGGGGRLPRSWSFPAGTVPSRG